MKVNTTMNTCVNIVLEAVNTFTRDRPTDINNVIKDFRGS